MAKRWKEHTLQFFVLPIARRPRTDPHACSLWPCWIFSHWLTLRYIEQLRAPSPPFPNKGRTSMSQQHFNPSPRQTQLLCDSHTAHAPFQPRVALHQAPSTHPRPQATSPGVPSPAFPFHTYPRRTPNCPRPHELSPPYAAPHARNPPHCLPPPPPLISPLRATATAPPIHRHPLPGVFPQPAAPPTGLPQL